MAPTMQHLRVLQLMFLIALTSAPEDCPWRIKSLTSSNGRTSLLYKSVNARTSMHCVHRCVSTPRCNAVYFADTKCGMFKSLKVEVHGKQGRAGIFHVRQAVWPEKFVSQMNKIKKKGYASKHVKGTSSTVDHAVNIPEEDTGKEAGDISSLNEHPNNQAREGSSLSDHHRNRIGNKDDLMQHKPDVKATELAATTNLMSAKAPCHLWPENILRPQTTRQMTEEICSQHDGYTYLSDTMICIKYIKKKFTWLGARKQCWKEGADLVKWDTEKKGSSCHQFLTNQGEIPKFSIPKLYWIGLQLQPCGSIWIDGSPLTTDIFPKHSSKMACASVRTDPFQGRNRRSCKKTAFAFICEIV